MVNVQKVKNKPEIIAKKVPIIKPAGKNRIIINSPSAPVGLFITFKAIKIIKKAKTIPVKIEVQSSYNSRDGTMTVSLESDDLAGLTDELAGKRIRVLNVQDN